MTVLRLAAGPVGCTNKPGHGRYSTIFGPYRSCVNGEATEMPYKSGNLTRVVLLSPISARTASAEQAADSWFCPSLAVSGATWPLR